MGTAEYEAAPPWYVVGALRVYQHQLAFLDHHAAMMEALLHAGFAGPNATRRGPDDFRLLRRPGPRPDPDTLKRKWTNVVAMFRLASEAAEATRGAGATGGGDE